MLKRHMTAIGLALALMGTAPVQAQDLNLTPEELQAFQGSAQVVRRTITELAVESLSLA